MDRYINATLLCLIDQKAYNTSICIAHVHKTVVTIVAIMRALLMTSPTTIISWCMLHGGEKMSSNYMARQDYAQICRCLVSFDTTPI